MFERRQQGTASINKCLMSLTGKTTQTMPNILKAIATKNSHVHNYSYLPGLVPGPVGMGLGELGPDPLEVPPAPLVHLL